jgi:hypothetical protein
MVVAIFALPTGAVAENYYVAENGSNNGDGSFENPWDLQTALNQPAAVNPGDTIYVQGGRYVGHFTCNLHGSPERLIHLLPYADEHVTLDGNIGVDGSVLSIDGEYAHIQGFEITTSITERVQDQTPIPRVTGLEILGSNNKLINLDIHDNTINGVGFWRTSVNSELNGCYVYNNGIQIPGLGSGHGIYTQNIDGIKIIKDNMVFNNFQYGIHAYTSNGDVEGFNFDGNTVFGNGSITEGGGLDNGFVIGGTSRPVDRFTFSNNNFYTPFGSIGEQVRFGYGALNPSMVAHNNIFSGGQANSIINSFTDLEYYNNIHVSEYDVIRYINDYGIDDSQYIFDSNLYFMVGSEWNKPFWNQFWTDWRDTNSFDRNSTYFESYPSTNFIRIRPNDFEAGRGHVIVLNYLGLDSVEVDVSSILIHGAEYHVYDIQNMRGNAVASGTYSGGPISIPMNLTTMNTPTGNVPTIPEHTGSDFGIYLITSRDLP